MNLLNLEALEHIVQTEGLFLPISRALLRLSLPLRVADRTLPNRLVIQPMEGCDAEADGAPGELTERRYLRFAQSGAALIWFEATAIVAEGKANPRQLMLTQANLPHFQRLVARIREAARKASGFEPLLILQATHSGRYSKPNGAPAPIPAYHSPIYEPSAAIADDCIASDAYLDSLPERYAQTARLAQAAGFDGVDIKACHRYLLSELFSAFTRPGRYGGDFERRTRLFLDALRAAQAATAAPFLTTARLNVYDGAPAPYGFGANAEGGVDLAEPIRLVRTLRDEFALPLLNITIGNPYVNPHVNRPFDRGAYTPPESPLSGVARICACTAQIKRAAPSVALISSGNSYLRDLAPYVAAGMLEHGAADLIGFGREAFAYPDFARALLTFGRLDPQKCCVTCSKCTELMRAGGPTGCVVRDSAVYAPLYRRYVVDK